MRIKNLNEDIRRHNKYKLFETRMNALCDELDPNVKLINMTRVHDTTEDREGKIFIGSSGEIFN